MKKILITNDDGITSGGIIRLAETACAFGEVWVIAPDGQRSACSHSITLAKPIHVWKTSFPVSGVHAYATDGCPADCVRFGIKNFVKDADYIFSGINAGWNVGSDLQYSATAGAALEGSNLGILSIAFSEGADGLHEVTDFWLKRIMEELMNAPLKDNDIWNVNFPSCPLSSLKGILRDRKVSRNSFYRDEFQEEVLPDGKIRLTTIGHYQENGADGTDFRAVTDCFISIGTVSNLK